MPKVNIETFTGFQVGAMTPENNPIDTLNKAKLYLPEKWWISAGTAIALYRDGDFIYGNTDIDIGVNTSEIVKIPTLTEFRRTSWNDKVMQQAFKDTNDVILDIFHYYTDIVEGKLVSVSELGYITKPLFEIKDLDTKYGKLPFLHPIEKYLEDRYQDWRTPDPQDHGRHTQFLH
jgi:hypothetical protein